MGAPGRIHGAAHHGPGARAAAPQPLSRPRPAAAPSPALQRLGPAFGLEPAGRPVQRTAANALAYPPNNNNEAMPNSFITNHVATGNNFTLNEAIQRHQARGNVLYNDIFDITGAQARTEINTHLQGIANTQVAQDRLTNARYLDFLSAGSYRWIQTVRREGNQVSYGLRLQDQTQVRVGSEWWGNTANTNGGNGAFRINHASR